MGPEQTPNSRDKILEVAEPLFASRGYTGVGLREVAEAAGLGKSSLFHHFRNKVQLYCQVLDRVLTRIQERVDAALARPGTCAQRLDAWVDALIDALAEHPPSARLLLRGLVEDEDLPPEAETSEEALAVGRTIEKIVVDVRKLIREGVRSGEFRNVSAAHTLQTLIGATVYHFASGEFGEGMIGGSLLSADAVRRRREEVKAILHQGLASAPAGGKS